MENLIEVVRTALRDDADPVARRAGLVACRKLLAVLETAMDEEAAPAPTAVPSSATTAAPPPTEAPSSATTAAAAPTAAPSSPTTSMPIDSTTVATLFASLGTMPPEQLLDLAIARLRAALPPGAGIPAPTPLRFQLVPLNHLKQPK